MLWYMLARMESEPLSFNLHLTTLALCVPGRKKKKITEIFSANRWVIKQKLYGSDGQESACNAGDKGSIPGSGRFLGGGHGNPLQYSWPGESHGQRSLAGYRPQGRKDLNTAERLRLSRFFLLCFMKARDKRLHVFSRALRLCDVVHLDGLLPLGWITPTL